MEFIDKINELESSQRSLRSSLESLKSLRSDNTELRSELASLQSELRTLRAALKELQSEQKEAQANEDAELKNNMSLLMLNKISDFISANELEFKELFKARADEFLASKEDELLYLVARAVASENEEIKASAEQSIQSVAGEYKKHLQEASDELELRADELLASACKEFLNENKAEVFKNLDIGFLKYELSANAVFREALKKASDEALSRLLQNEAFKQGLKDEILKLAKAAIHSEVQLYEQKSEHFKHSLKNVNLHIQDQLSTMQSALKNISELDYYDKRAQASTPLNKTYAEK